MKYIFDFDDVLFNNSKKFKPHMYACLEKAGIPKDITESYYEEIRGNREIHGSEFLPKKFISELLTRNRIKKDAGNIYEDMLSVVKNFLNTELLTKVNALGKENCYLVTQGNIEFHQDKIEKSETAPLFREVIYVPHSKKEVIENICKKHKNEEVFFIDDRQKFFDELNMTNCPNLKTILYTGQDISDIL